MNKKSLFTNPILIGSLVALIIIGAFAFGFWLRGSNRDSRGMMDEQHGAGGTMMSHGNEIKSESDFIMEMIPHHQEAVDTSKYMLTRTTDEEFKSFMQNIIDAQEKEITQMKNWHKEWFSSDYKDDGRYSPMMPDLESIKDDTEAREAYLQGMLHHHESAIVMAEAVKKISDREELIQFADGVIEAQSAEVKQIREWLGLPENDEKTDQDMMSH